MEGLSEVKKAVDDLLGLVIGNAEREEQELKLVDVLLNRVFLGNPGTGKTTVAKLYARILGDLGLLSKGDVIVKTPSDMVGDVLGSSEKNTRAILEASKGCVLVIDEAYGLCPSVGVKGKKIISAARKSCSPTWLAATPSWASCVISVQRSSALGTSS